MEFIDLHSMLIKNKIIILWLEESHESYLSVSGMCIISVI